MGFINRIKILIPYFLFALLLVSFAQAARTVVILNDLFIDFAVTSNNPYWINDSQIVHGVGRIDYKDDGRYILTNAKTYYTMLNRSYHPKLKSIWAKYAAYISGDFDADVMEHYEDRPLTNFTKDLDLKKYWYERKDKAFWFLS